MDGGMERDKKQKQLKRSMIPSPPSSPARECCALIALMVIYIEVVIVMVKPMSWSLVMVVVRPGKYWSAEVL